MFPTGNFRNHWEISSASSGGGQLPLRPLGPEEIEELLHALIAGDPSVAALPGLIRERTGGNPFFIEEVVQSLVESRDLEGARGAYRLVKPIASLEVPTTVQPLLAARIDRLPEREKRLLQTAAVIGREFSESLLKRVADLPDSELAEALSQLQSSEFIVEQALYPEVEYTFKHPLTQSVAQDSQLSEQRQLNPGIVPVLEPSVIVDHVDPVINVGDGLDRSLRRRPRGRPRRRRPARQAFPGGRVPRSPLRVPRRGRLSDLGAESGRDVLGEHRRVG